nr:MAG TPA: hypothetical protein [Bacteriophage sp.]
MSDKNTTKPANKRIDSNYIIIICSAAGLH